MQPDIIRLWFAAGKYVLLEKPIAKDVSTARLLLEDYEKIHTYKSIIFNVEEQFGYLERTKLAQTWLVDEKALGQLAQVYLKLWHIIKARSKYYEIKWRKAR